MSSDPSAEKAAEVESASSSGMWAKSPTVLTSTLSGRSSIETIAPFDTVCPCLAGEGGAWPRTSAAKVP